MRLFAVLREAAGISQTHLELPPQTSAADAASKLAGQYPAIARHLPHLAFAINQAYAPASSALQDGDELALIPPVSGG